MAKSTQSAEKAAGGKSPLVKMAVTAVALFVTAGIGLFAVLQFTDNERARELKQWQVRMGIVADNRQADIQEWVDDQLTEMRALADNQSLQSYVTFLVEFGAEAEDAGEVEYLGQLLTVAGDRAGFKQALDSLRVEANVARVGAAGIGLLDNAGNIIVATSDFPPVDGFLLEFLSGTPQGKLGISPIYMNGQEAATMAFSVPVYNLQGDNSAASQVGVVVGVKQVGEELFSLLDESASVEGSAESLLVVRNNTIAQYLNPLADESPALQKKLSMDTPDLAAAFALENPDAFGVKIDYDGQEVLLTSRQLEHVPWTYIYKIDREEALAEAENRLTILTSMLVGILVVVLLGMVVLWYYGTSRRATEAADKFERLASRFEDQRNFMHLVTDSQPNLITILDEHGHFRWFNQKMLNASGMGRRDLYDKHVTQILGPAQGKRFVGWVREALEKSEPVTVTHELTTADGSSAVYKSDFIPLEARDDISAGVLVVAQDISDSVRERQRREQVMRQLVNTLVSVVDRRDPYSANHSIRVGEVSEAVGREMQIDAVELETATIAGSLMNLGKITVPKSVLTKAGKLTQEEFILINQSIHVSADLVEDIDFDGPVAQTLHELYEQFDGSGPKGLQGDDILISARIAAVANTFVGMVSARAYREGMAFDDAIDIMFKETGSKFDRRVVVALANYLDNRGGREAWRAYGEKPANELDEPVKTD